MTSVPSESFTAAVNSYCFIMGTFTVDRLHSRKVGTQVPHPGVGPPEEGDSITYHTYYQWVPFVLFVQVGTSFFFFIFAPLPWGDTGYLESLSEGP